MSFRIRGVPEDTFRHLFSLTDKELASHGATRCIADAKPGYPCRVTLRDADIGETLILDSFEHHTVNGPFRASGPIFVRESATEAYDNVNEIPELLQRRTLSVRAYTRSGIMKDANVIDGKALEATIERFFSNEAVGYLHVHNARRGCFMCHVDRL